MGICQHDGTRQSGRTGQGRRLPLSAALVVATLALPMSPAWAQPQPALAPTPERAAALAAVERYFQAADSGSADAVRGVFWATGRVEGVGGGRLLSWSADEFATRSFRGQPKPLGDIIRTIEWLDVSGTGAVARVRTTIGANDTYWDYFLLHKQAGEWKIGLKAFANPERPG